MFALEQKKTALRARSAAPQVQQRHPQQPTAQPGPSPARSCPCGGSCPRCQAKSALAIGAANDASERQADAAADRLMRMPSGPGAAPAPIPGLRGGGASPAPAQDVPGVPSSVDRALGSPGQALDAGTRSFFESGFGQDFSRVRLHSDAAAARSAQDVNALAYTVGQHIVFDSGRLAPHTREGRHLLAHELAHVVQQSGAGRAGAVVQRLVRPENVTCHDAGLTNPDLTGDEAVTAIAEADAEAIELARNAEDELTAQLASARAGNPLDAFFENILQEEFSLTLSNPADFGRVQQIINRFRRVRETLESGYLRYMCRADGNVSLVGCAPGNCDEAAAFSCPGNRLVVLCQAFWDEPQIRGWVILHEPFHIWFDMALHQMNAPKRADVFCYQTLAQRVSHQLAEDSCGTHTAGY